MIHAECSTDRRYIFPRTSFVKIVKKLCESIYAKRKKRLRVIVSPRKGKYLGKSNYAKEINIYALEFCLKQVRNFGNKFMPHNYARFLA